MKKSNFVALLLGTVSVVLFALGMCMALLPEWNAFVPGIVFGAVGLILGLITWLVWRKMEHKQPLRCNPKALGMGLYIVFSVLVLGAGMCLCLVWQNFVIGTLVGLAGIVLLIFLIPMVKGLK